jgi:histone deacetylase 6
VTADTSDVGKYEEEDVDRPSQTEELAGYLWDNYIEPNEATHVFFIGVGDAFYGVANLLINRGEFTLSIRKPDTANPKQTASTNASTA